MSANRPLSLKSVLLYDWQYKLTLLFTGLFLYQFVRWFGEEQGGWLPETVTLVGYTLLFTFVAELMPARNRTLLRMAEFLILLIYYALALGYHPILEKFDTFAAFSELFFRNAVQFYPLLWFGMGAWLVYLGAIWWAGSKTRIYWMLLLSLLAIAIRDSFSVVVLWNEAAWMILCGLFLVVVRHFANLKKKNPSGWVYFSDYPIAIVTPVVILLLCTVGAGMLAPNVSHVLKDPYTLWMNWKGQTVALTGKGVLADVPSLQGSATSGYSRNDQNLGGGFSFDYSPVMSVETTQRSYWRGETRAFYNGKGWEKSQQEKQSPLTKGLAAGSALPQDSSLPAGNLKTIEVKQTITIAGGESYPVLFGALSPDKIEKVNDDNSGFDRISWSPKSSELRWNEPRNQKGYPKTYTVISKMPVIDENALRSVPAGQPDRAAVEEYLQLPSSLPDRVRQLAQDVSKAGATPYDKVKLIESYLQTNYRYTNTPKEKGSPNDDFVDRFLFDTREGYCDYFSTAMAVMVRSIGMPSRWVKGYAPGTLDQDVAPLGGNPGAPPAADGAGVYSVRNSDAHSWVEVYFAGMGWVPFEPTSGFILPTVSVPEETEKAPVPETTAPPVDQPAEAPAGTSFPWGKTAAIAAALLAAAAAAYAVWSYRSRKGLLGSRRKTVSFNQQLIIEYNRLVRYSRRKGYPVYEHETARETIGRWKEKDSWLSRDLDQLLDLFEKAKYSPRTVTAEEAGRASGLVRKLRGEM